jgi:DNA polymerase-3 subunit delta'
VRIGDFGQPHVEALLERMLERDRAGGPFLFDGPPGVGKEAVAVELGRVLNCENAVTCPARAPFTRAGAKAAAPRCGSCRKFDALQHPDLLLVFPVPTGTWDERLSTGRTDDKRTDTLGRILQAKAQNPYYKPDDFERPAVIEAEVLREKVLAAAQTRPVEARTKVIVIADADQATRDMANILLKTLEEPAPNCLIVLTTAVPQRLLPTIVSRCQRLRFAPLDPAWMQARLEALCAVPAAKSRLAAAIALGSMLGAMRILNGDFEAARDRAFEVLDWAANGRELELLETAQALQQGHAKKRHAVPMFLQMMTVAARDALLVDAGVAGRGTGTGAGVALVNSDRAPAIAAAARAFGAAGLRTIVRGAETAERQIAGNAALEPTLAAYLLDVARAAAPTAAPTPARRRA